MKLYFVCLACFASQTVFAAYFDNNLRDGLNFGISGTLSPSLATTHDKFSYTYGDPRVFDTPQTLGTLQDVLEAQDMRDTDRRLRLQGVNNGSLFFSASQQLTRNTRASADLGLVAEPTSLSPYAYGLTLTNSELGQVAFQSNIAFDSVKAMPTATFSALDVSGLESSVISANFSKLQNFNLGGYYVLPQSTDVRHVDELLHRGHGLVLSYDSNPTPDSKLQWGVAYTQGHRHNLLNSNTVAKQKKAWGAGVKYRLGDWGLSLDTSQGNENLSGEVVDSVRTNTHGAKLEYRITPRLRTAVYYGQSNSRKQATAGQSLNFESILQAKSGISENVLFDKVNSKVYGANVNYALHPNVSLNGSVSATQTDNYLTEGKFSSRNSVEYRVGTTFSF